jgi:hypothetical protein
VADEARAPLSRADAAWEELQRLRAEARELGLEVDEGWPLAEIRERVAAARERGGADGSGG